VLVQLDRRACHNPRLCPSFLLPLSAANIIHSRTNSVKGSMFPATICHLPAACASVTRAVDDGIEASQMPHRRRWTTSMFPKADVQISPRVSHDSTPTNTSLCISWCRHCSRPTLPWLWPGQAGQRTKGPLCAVQMIYSPLWSDQLNPIFGIVLHCIPFAA
jgi:hypothetical protein